MIILGLALAQNNPTELFKEGITGHKSHYIVNGLFPELMLVR